MPNTVDDIAHLISSPEWRLNIMLIHVALMFKHDCALCTLQIFHIVFKVYEKETSVSLIEINSTPCKKPGHTLS